MQPDVKEQAFEAFVRADGDRLRKVMSSQYGVDIGGEATDSALAWAWEHWDRLRAMANPAGHLYRVSQTKARREISRGRTVTFPSEPTRGVETPSSLIDGDLAAALASMPERHRVAVLMVHAYG